MAATVLLILTVTAQAQDAVRVTLRQPQPLALAESGDSAQSATEYLPQPMPSAFPPLRVPSCAACGNPGPCVSCPTCVPAPLSVPYLQHIRGRLLYDTGFFNHHPYNHTLPPFEDAQALRSARIGAEGKLWEQLWYRAEFDFANGDGRQINMNNAIEIKDVFLEFTRTPLIGNVRIGHFKEPFSLEQQTPQTDITFMERSLMDRGRPILTEPGDVQTTNTDLIPSRSTGVMLQNAWLDGRLWAATGWFRVDSDTQGFDNGDGDYAFTTRITGLPYWQQDGRYLIHVGGAYSYREYREPAPGAGNLPAFTSRVATLGTPLLLNTGIIQNADRGDLYGAELAAVFGPLSLQAEYVCTHIDQLPGSPDLNYWGSYLNVSYFLTGENRRYNKCTAAFDRVVPRRNFFCVAGNPCETKNLRFCVGPGAWELAARYSIVDLSGGLIRPVDGLLPGNNTQSLEGGTGVLREWTIGLNWYWNANARFMFNYVQTERDSDSVGDGMVSSVLWRFQVDW